MKEKTLVLIKPDGVKRKLVGKIISIYEENNLEIIELKMVMPTEDIIRNHYIEHIEKAFFPELREYFLEGSICCLILGGENAIQKVRNINGNTDPKEAVDGSIRKLYGKNKTRNLVHSSDCIESAKREINIWFK
ncbi:nucleoside-diphosphate kinase [Clostridium sediminicola]|uniref:nucleoside-diphosphate kinase n=1 Tax=Clostridium sediminicola TaxID=3114879 RepID=UPI0031F26A80